MQTATLEAPAQVPAVTPAAPSAPAAPAPEKIDASTFDRDIALGKTTPDALAGLYPKPAPLKPTNRSPAAAPTPAAPAAPAPAAPAATAPGTPAAPAAPAAVETPAAAPATPPADPNDPKFVKNWRLTAKDAKEAMVAELVRNGAGFQEAVAEVYGSPAAPAAAPATPAAPVPPPVDLIVEADTKISGLANSIADLEGKIDDLSEKGEYAAAQKLIRQQTDIKLDLQRAKDQRELMHRERQDRQVMSAVEKHQQHESESIGKIYELYPKLADKGSEQRAQFNLKMAELEKNPAYGDLDPATGRNNFRQLVPGWPMLVARAVAEEHGWSRSAAAPVAFVPAPANPPMNPNPAQPAAQIPVPAVRATAAEVISPSPAPGGTNPALDAKTFWKDSENTDPDTLIKLMGHAPIDPRLLRKQKLDPRRF